MNAVSQNTVYLHFSLQVARSYAVLSHKKTERYETTAQKLRRIPLRHRNGGCVFPFFPTSFRAASFISFHLHILKIRLSFCVRWSQAVNGAVPLEEEGASLLAPLLEQAHPLAPAVGAPQVASARWVVAAIVRAVVATAPTTNAAPLSCEE